MEEFTEQEAEKVREWIKCLEDHYNSTNQKHVLTTGLTFEKLKKNIVTYTKYTPTCPVCYSVMRIEFSEAGWYATHYPGHSCVYYMTKKHDTEEELIANLRKYGD